MEQKKTTRYNREKQIEALDSRLGDITGQLERFVTLPDGTHDRLEEHSFRSQTLRNAGLLIERRRHNLVLEHAQSELNANLERVAALLEEAVKNRIAPPGSETVRYRGMGLQIEATGKPGDAHFDAASDAVQRLGVSHESIRMARAQLGLRMEAQDEIRDNARRQVEEAFAGALQMIGTFDVDKPIALDDARQFLQALREKVEGAFSEAD